MAKRILQLEVSPNYLNLGKFNKDFLQRLNINLSKILVEKRKELIVLQFVNYPKESKSKVIKRSGRFLKSLRHKVVKNGKLGFAIDTYYNGKYQTIQPSDGATSVTIRARNKKYLTIPNPKNKEIFDKYGSHIYEGIPLYIDDEPNPEHPLSEELFIRPRRKEKGETNKTLRLTDIDGKIFYYLKKQVTIKTKRPITKADRLLLKESQTLIDKAMQQTMAEFFNIKESKKPKTRKL